MLLKQKMEHRQRHRHRDKIFSILGVSFNGNALTACVLLRAIGFVDVLVTSSFSLPCLSASTGIFDIISCAEAAKYHFR